LARPSREGSSPAQRQGRVFKGFSASHGLGLVWLMGAGRAGPGRRFNHQAAHGSKGFEPGPVRKRRRARARSAGLERARAGGGPILLVEFAGRFVGTFQQKRPGIRPQKLSPRLIILGSDAHDAERSSPTGRPAGILGKLSTVRSPAAPTTAGARTSCNPPRRHPIRFQ